MLDIHVPVLLICLFVWLQFCSHSLIRRLSTLLSSFDNWCQCYDLMDFNNIFTQWYM